MLEATFLAPSISIRRGFKREMIVAYYGSMLYNIWKARYMKLFQEHSVNTVYLYQQIRLVITDRVTMYKQSKYAGRCIGYIDRICH